TTGVSPIASSTEARTRERFVIMSSLSRRPRHELGRGRPRLRTPEVARELDRAGRVVLLEVRPIHGVLDPLAARLYGTHADAPLAHLDHTGRLFQERAVPAPRLEAPRPDEQPALDHDHPDPDDAVRRGPRAQAEDLSLAQRLDHGGLEARPRRAARAQDEG